MKSSRLTHVALFALAGLTAACSAPTDPDLYAPELVLKAMLPVNEGIDTVFLSKTLPLNTGYTFEKAAISGADIRITAETGESVVLQEYAGKPGRYGAPLFTIKPLTTYFLSVTVDGFPSISAETKTPGVLNPLIVNKDSVSFIGDSFNTDSLSVQWNAVEGSVNYLISSRFLGPDSTKIRIDTPFNEEDDPEEDPNVRSSWVNAIRLTPDHNPAFRQAQ